MVEVSNNTLVGLRFQPCVKAGGKQMRLTNVAKMNKVTEPFAFCPGLNVKGSLSQITSALQKIGAK